MIVVIPMAGTGSRFAERGYTFPKPLITIRNKPMIQWVVESLNMPYADHVFVVRQEHIDQYALHDVVKQLVPKSTLIAVRPTEGAACTVLEALRIVDILDEDLLIANCDQWLAWDSNHFLQTSWAQQAEGAIPLFHSTHPKWSYADVGGGRVLRVEEKQPISPYATCGVYYWKTGRRFVECAERMVKKNVRTNGEFYVAPVYNELLAKGGLVVPYSKLEMWSLGTPEDLEEFKLGVCTGRIP